MAFDSGEPSYELGIGVPVGTGAVEILQQKAHQLVGLGKTRRYSTLQSRETFSQIQCAIISDVASNRH